jgi:predicted  nucleic acid-binding Zn-ribbon protein
MILELLILQMTLDGIRTKVEQDLQKQQRAKDLNKLKLKLARLLQDYQSGNITADEYKTMESQIASAITGERIQKKRHRQKAM